MKFPTASNPALWLAGTAGFIAAFFLGGAFANDGLFGSITAAWVQAIGTFAAIGGAAWLQNRQRAKERADRAAQQLTALVAFSSHVVAVLRQADESTRALGWQDHTAAFARIQLSAGLSNLRAVPATELQQIDEIKQWISLIMITEGAVGAMLAIQAAISTEQVPHPETFEVMLKQAIDAKGALKNLARSALRRQSAIRGQDQR